ncbi:MAG: hypothetical protein GXW99_11985 [Clostridiales bacterium]|nr:hypothetical protein [Clostridiales bacterium]
MKNCAPQQYWQFKCLAGACPDTCCAGWELPVDADSAARYAMLGGTWGDRLKEAVETVDGEKEFRRSDGRCVFLNDGNLCELYAGLGEEALCRVCRQHPRFIAEYGSLREIMPSLSCPAWVQLYLMTDDPVKFVTRTDDEPVTSYNDIDAMEFYRLHKAREKAIAIVQNREKPLRLRIEELLCFAAALAGESVGKQENLPNHILNAYRRKLQGMEILTPRWRSLLREKPFVKPETPSWREMVGEQVIVYYLFRFFLRAVYDGGILPWTKLAVWSWIVVQMVGSGCETRERFCEIIRLYSKEIEHNEKNVDGLYRVLCRHEGRYGAEGLLAALEELG